MGNVEGVQGVGGPVNQPAPGGVVQNPVAPVAVAANIVPIRDFRPRRSMYTRLQKERAVRLLDMGIPCRQVARMIGPRCSSGSPIRWRQQARRQAEARRRLETMMQNRAAGMNP